MNNRTKMLVSAAFDGPDHAFAGAFAVGVDFQGFLQVGNAGARGGQGGHHQPGFFHVWGQMGSLDSVVAGRGSIACAQGFLGDFEGAICGYVVGVHGAGAIFSLLM